MGFSRQEYQSGLPFLLQEIFPTQGSNPHLLLWQADSLLPSHLGSLLQLIVKCKGGGSHISATTSRVTHLFSICSFSQTSRPLISTERTSDSEEAERSERTEVRREGRQKACVPAADQGGEGLCWLKVWAAPCLLIWGR